ncbi:MAG: DNA-binding transcriptional LysR family regulator [Verrucomicrobiales bacterium]|jgi:DNA-binding transcriptional LysR family regulator
MNQKNAFMNIENELPIDVHALHLFRLVAESGSFTHAGKRAGLTQSAVTRQVQRLEERLGLPLFERTTRAVRLTPAGEYLFNASASLLASLTGTVREIREKFTEAPKLIRVGISRSIGLSYLPGFFNAHSREHPETITDVVYDSSATLLDLLQTGELDVGLLTAQQSLPKGLVKTHRFTDAFTLIIPPDASVDRRSKSLLTLTELRNNAPNQRWILPSEITGTGRALRHWLDQQEIAAKASIQTANLDLIVNLVSLGMGWGLVPNRALPLYARRRVVQKIPLKVRYEREIAVVIRGQRTHPPHLEEFVRAILF